MDAALIGLAGTTIGAVTGFGGAWLAQRGQLRLFREQRSYEMRARWADEKRGLYRDLLVAMYEWHDALVSIWQGQDNGKLFESRMNATRLATEVSLIATAPVRAAVEDVHRTFLESIQPRILGRSSASGAPPVEGLWEKITALEEALRSELVSF